MLELTDYWNSNLSFCFRIFFLAKLNNKIHVFIKIFINTNLHRTFTARLSPMLGAQYQRAPTKHVDAL
jgi:hypothetical protein